MTADKLREYAERSRRLATSSTNQGMASALNELADEYLERAERLEAAAQQESSTAPSEQQPMQQQRQVQPKKEDKE
jgi:hypothetical protein